MTRLETTNLMWGIGLSRLVAATLHGQAGDAYVLKTFPASRVPEARELAQDNPAVIWIAWRAWKAMSLTQQQFFQRLESAAKILLLNEDVRLSAVEALLSLGHFSTMRLPLRPERVRETLDRAMEVSHLYDDIYAMTQEISLERELLARKNDQLSFINAFIGRVAGSLDPVAVLDGARQELKRLLPLDLLQGVFWNAPPSPEGMDAATAVDLPLVATVFLSTDKASDTQHAWLRLLLDAAATTLGRTVSSFQIASLAQSDYERAILPPAPSPSQVLILPASTGGRQFGCLALHATAALSLGRDQVELLHTAASHLSLALKNALLYHQTRSEAEFDGLTRVYNRKHFDRRLREELSRHERYGHDLSVLLLDADHFKKVNDTYGHQAGDMVLSEIGRVLKETVRTTDYPARYGGEEFAIILPQTDGAQAWTLAERLRQRIMALRFQGPGESPCENTGQGKSFRVTASIGIGSYQASGGSIAATLPTAESLLRAADEALYLAKHQGRNRVHWAGGSREMVAAG